MTRESDPAVRARRIKAIAALVGVFLALLCPELPSKYQKPCTVIAQVSTMTCQGSN